MTLNELIISTAKENGFKAVKCCKFEKWQQWTICDQFDVLAVFQTTKEKDELIIGHIQTIDVSMHRMEKIIEVFQLIEDGFQYVTK